MVKNTQMKIEDVTTIKSRGATPSEQQILETIQNRQSEGLELADTKINAFFDPHNGMKEYLVVLMFKEPEKDAGDYFNSGDWTTEELGADELE